MNVNLLAKQARSLRSLRDDLSRRWKYYRPGGSHRCLTEQLIRQVDDARKALDSLALREAREAGR